MRSPANANVEQQMKLLREIRDLTRSFNEEQEAFMAAVLELAKGGGDEVLDTLDKALSDIRASWERNDERH